MLTADKQLISIAESQGLFNLSQIGQNSEAKIWKPSYRHQPVLCSLISQAISASQSAHYIIISNHVFMHWYNKFWFQNISLWFNVINCDSKWWAYELERNLEKNKHNLTKYFVVLEKFASPYLLQISWEKSFDCKLVNFMAIPIKCFVFHRPPSREGGSVGRAKKKKRTNTLKC